MSSACSCSCVDAPPRSRSLMVPATALRRPALPALSLFCLMLQLIASGQLTVGSPSSTASQLARDIVAQMHMLRSGPKINLRDAEEQQQLYVVRDSTGAITRPTKAHLRRDDPHAQHVRNIEKLAEAARGIRRSSVVLSGRRRVALAKAEVELKAGCTEHTTTSKSGTASSISNSSSSCSRATRITADHASVQQQYGPPSSVSLDHDDYSMRNYSWVRGYKINRRPPVPPSGPNPAGNDSIARQEPARISHP